MDIVLMLLCVAGLAFVVRQVEGPFNIFGMLRNLVAKIPLVGPMFHKTLTCNFCLGFWVSVGLYFFNNSFSSMSLSDLLVWSFGGGMFNSLFSKMMDKLDINPIAE